MWEVVIPVISSIAGGTIVATANRWLTRRREREAEWRALRFGQYKEFGLALAGLAVNRNKPGSQERYSDAYTGVQLIAPKDVLVAIQAFQEIVTVTKRHQMSTEDHDRALNQLFRAIRRDIHPSMRVGEDQLSFSLVGVSPSSPS